MKVGFPLRVILALCMATVAAEAKVVINEIFYHAPNDVEDLQWVELHNHGVAPVDLAGWALTKGVKLKFPPGTRIAPGGFLVVCRNQDRFRAAYGFAAAAEFEKTLRRKGERIELSDATGAVVETVKFDDRSPWPVGAAGFSASLERICPEAFASLPENWASSPLRENPDEAGGTPGKTNSNHSPNLPPAVGQVKHSPASPKAMQPVEIEAEVEDADGIKGVTLLYRVIEPGKESEEQTIPMSGRGNRRFTASIPGLPAERLVRYRIRAEDAVGTHRLHPGANEPRPAISYWVQGEMATNKLSTARLMHVDSADFARSQRQQRSGARAGFNEDDMLRWNIQNMVRSSIDPAALWVAIAVKQESTSAQRSKWRPHFERLVADQDSLIAKQQAATDLQAALNEAAQRAQELKQAFVKTLQPLLEGPQVPELESWLSGGMANVNPSRMRGEMMLRRALRLEPAFQAVTIRDDLLPAQFASVREAYSESRRQREELIEIAGAVRDADSYEKLNEKVGGVMESVQARLKAVLPAEQFSAMEKALEADRASQSFGSGRGRSTLASVVQGRSALIWQEAGSRETRVYDFVTISDRKAGYKVRLQRDRPLNGMTAVNLIFEEDERMVMAEPLALELYRAAGMPASLTDFVEVSMDGSPLGFHLLIEQPNSAFLHRNGITDGGDIFKYLWFERGIAGQHEKKNNPHRNHDDLLKFVERLSKTSGVEQWQIIKKDFEVEEVINYYAVNMLLSHWDGFMNNFFVYHEFRDTGKWMLFPWDQDKTWGVYDGIPQNEVFATLPLSYGKAGDAPPGWTKDRPPRSFFETMNIRGSEWWRPPGYFSGPLLSNPYFRRHYLARIKELLETQFTEERIFPRLDVMQGQLQEAVKSRARLRREDEAAAAETFSRNMASFRKFVKERRQFLLAQEELRSVGAYDRTQLK